MIQIRLFKFSLLIAFSSIGLLIGIELFIVDLGKLHLSLVPTFSDWLSESFIFIKVAFCTFILSYVGYLFVSPDRIDTIISSLILLMWFRFFYVTDEFYWHVFTINSYIMLVLGSIISYKCIFYAVDGIKSRWQITKA